MASTRHCVRLAALARGGAMRAPRMLAGEDAGGNAGGNVGGGAGGSARALFTPEACHLVSEALTGTPPGAAHLEGFACKTGTSWGRRDAWAVAYTPRFTVGVWAGNFSGEGSPSLVGGEAARPCAIEVLSWLGRSRRARVGGAIRGEVRAVAAALAAGACGVPCLRRPRVRVRASQMSGLPAGVPGPVLVQETPVVSCVRGETEGRVVGARGRGGAAGSPMRQSERAPSRRRASSVNAPARMILAV